MLKKSATIAAVVALVVAGALIGVGVADQGAACDGKTQSASAEKSQAPACTKSASAAKVSAATAGTYTCSKTTKASCAKTAQAQSACCANKARKAHYKQVRKVADNVPQRVNSRIVVAGTYKCGSCDLEATETCQPFIKTTDGQLYPLEKNKNVKQMYKSGTKKFEITARVTKRGGTKYLDVTNYKAL